MFKNRLPKYSAFAIAFICILQSARLQGMDFFGPLVNIKTAINKAQKKKTTKNSLNSLVAALGVTTDILCALKPKDVEQEALKKEYRQLLQRELALQPTILEKIKWFFVQDIEQANSVAQYRKDLLLFFQKLFRHVVKQDIKNKRTYTISLGLKIADAGILTMKRLPLSWEEAVDQNSWLDRLSTDPNDSSAIKNLKKLYEKKKNPLQSTNALFPEIVVLEDNDTTIIPTTIAGRHNPFDNKIYLREKYTSIRWCSMLLHEFTHAIQFFEGVEMGGNDYRCIGSPLTTHPVIATEIEAEERAIQFHPDPEDLLLTLENCWNRSVSAEVHFPYLSIPEQYAVALKHFKLQGKQTYAQEANIALEKRKKAFSHIIKTCEKSLCGITTTSKAQAYPTCLSLLTQESTAMLANLLRGTNHPTGCKKFFDIKCKVLGIEQEDTKLKATSEN